VKRVLIAVVIAAVAIIAMVVYAAAKDEGAGAQTLTGTTLDGQPFDLADSKGTPTVVNFFFAKCVYCAQEAPDLVAFREAHPEVDVVGVAVYDSKQDTEAFVSKYGIEFPVVYEPEAVTADDWGVTGYPTTFFLDADGVVQDTIVGAGTFDQFEASLETVQPAG
jgi:cytochrome c biogenesis protein CcmG, thiol:disulfide interchange protein DsbE